MAQSSETLTERDAAVAWARTYNALDPSHIAPLLADDIRYASQWVLFEEIGNRPDFLEYLTSKLETIRRSGCVVRAELAETRPYPMYPNPPQPCVVVEQDGAREATILFEVDGHRITRIDMCEIPPPHTCACSGEFPGLDAATGASTGPTNEA
jgi:hypothetical protein